MRALATCIVAALVVAGGARANPYVGTLADGGTASIAGTVITCHTSGGTLGCAVTKGGRPDPKTWAFTIDDSRVQAGKVSASSAAYTSPKQPKASGAPLTGKAKKLTVRVGQNFGLAGSHIGCSVLKIDGKVGVACTLVGVNGAIHGAYGAYVTSHALQVRTTEGAKSKVLFSRTF